eukprot:TRINITY_DN2116_c0_g1_i2.p1 TRINITY_DN2116_c0_g1~~TRINITY_DN2116_c0_g1_i2.p1  ORF type:complete len:435 (+),score=114.80 TRINITY_DN2116_c0_g1_i2:165-1469(+)
MAEPQNETDTSPLSSTSNSQEFTTPLNRSRSFSNFSNFSNCTPVNSSITNTLNTPNTPENFSNFAIGKRSWEYVEHEDILQLKMENENLKNEIQRQKGVINFLKEQEQEIELKHQEILKKQQQELEEQLKKQNEGCKNQIEKEKSEKGDQRKLNIARAREMFILSMKNGRHHAACVFAPENVIKHAKHKTEMDFESEDNLNNQLIIHLEKFHKDAWMLALKFPQNSRQKIESFILSGRCDIEENEHHDPSPHERQKIAENSVLAVMFHFGLSLRCVSSKIFRNMLYQARVSPEIIKSIKGIVKNNIPILLEETRAKIKELTQDSLSITIISDGWTHKGEYFTAVVIRCLFQNGSCNSFPLLINSQKRDGASIANDIFDFIKDLIPKEKLNLVHYVSDGAPVEGKTSEYLKMKSFSKQEQNHVLSEEIAARSRKC